jgi:hypothetical protein
MSHTLMSLDAEWRRLTRASRARRAGGSGSCRRTSSGRRPC